MAQTRKLETKDYIDIIDYLNYLNGYSDEDRRNYRDYLFMSGLQGTQEGHTWLTYLKEEAADHFFKFLFNNQDKNIILSSATSIPHLKHLINLPDKFDRLPLRHAIEKQNFHAVEFLLKNGAERQFFISIALNQCIQQSWDDGSQRNTQDIETAREILFYILDVMIQKNEPELQTQLSNLLLTLLRNTEKLDEAIFYKIANHITDFTQVNYFHDLVKFQDIGILLFICEKSNRTHFTKLNEKREGKTPLSIACMQPQKENFHKFIEYLIGQGAKLDKDFLNEIESFFFKNYQEDGVTKLHPFFYDTLSRLNLHKISWISLSTYTILKEKNLLLDDQTYLISATGGCLNKIAYNPYSYYSHQIIYTYQNQIFDSLPTKFYREFRKLMLRDSVYYTLLEWEISFIVKQHQKKQNILVNFNHIDISYLVSLTGCPDLDMDWTLVDLRGAKFNSWWLYTAVPSLVGVKVDLETLKNNGFLIQENPEKILEKRFQEDTKNLKEKFVLDYLTHFEKENDFHQLLNTLHLFNQDTQHIVRLNQDKNKPLFGETNSFETIMRAGQTRLHVLSQVSGFQWNSTDVDAQEKIQAVFKKNYTSKKNVISEIMQISVSTTSDSAGFLSAIAGFFSSAPTTTAATAPNISSANIDSSTSSENEDEKVFNL